jgi:hypothetical protein
MKELLWLAVLLLGMLVLLFGGLYIVSLMMKGMDILPQYIGEFSTIMLYIAFFMVLFAFLLKFSKND